MKITRHKTFFWLFAAIAAVQLLLNAGKPQRARPPRMQQTVAPGMFSERDRRLGYALVRIGTNETHDFSMPANAVLQEDWLAFGAFDDCFLTEDRTIVVSDGRLILPDGVAAEIFRAPLAVVPRFNWDRYGITNSYFWSAETASSTLYTWNNVFYRRNTDFPCTLQAEIFKSGDAVFRMQLPTNASPADATIGMRTAMRAGVLPPIVETNRIEVASNITSVSWVNIRDLAAGNGDFDSDGISDWDEIYIYGTNPRSSDTDRDGLSDSAEIAAGTNPKHPDTDGDGLADSIDAHPLQSDGACFGQCPAWVNAVFGTNAPPGILDCEAVVDALVGENATNGLYKFTLEIGTIPGDDVFGDRIAMITVERRGAHEGYIVFADSPGRYHFLLKKGVKYDFDITPNGTEIISHEFSDGLLRNDSSTIMGELHFTIPNALQGGSIEVVPPVWIEPDKIPPDAGQTKHYRARIDIPDGVVASSRWTAKTPNVSISNPFAAETDIARTTAAASCVESVVSIGERAITNRIGDIASTEIIAQESRISVSMPDTLYVNTDCDHSPQGSPDSDLSVAGPIPGENDLAPVFIELDADDGNWAARQVSLSAGGIAFYRHADKAGPLGDGAGSVATENIIPTGIVAYAEAREWSGRFGDRSLQIRSGYAVGRVDGLTFVDIVAEPVCNEWKRDGGTNYLYNPCAIVKDGKAWFKIRVDPGDYPAERIVWKISPAGAASFVGGNRGFEVAVSGNTPGERVSLSAQVGPLTNAVPVFTAEVVTNTVAKIYPMVITGMGKSFEYDAISDAEIRNMVDKANDIYRQIGLSFEIAGEIVRTNINEFTTFKSGYANPRDMSHLDFKRLLRLQNDMNGGAPPDGIEVYFINKLGRKDEGAAHRGGIVISRNAGSLVMAHEFGHLFGWPDIYGYSVSAGGIGAETEGGVSAARIPYDRTGDTGAKYYADALLQYELIERLLMNGYRQGDHVDIPEGGIFGMSREDADNNRQPSGNLSIGRRNMRHAVWGDLPYPPKTE